MVSLGPRMTVVIVVDENDVVVGGRGERAMVRCETKEEDDTDVNALHLH